MVAWIRTQLQSGIRLDRDTLAQMESVLGIRTPEELPSVEENSDSDAFIELLFFPDATLKMRYEHRWGSQRFTSAQVEDLISVLTSVPLRASVAVADRDAPFVVEAPDFAIAAFIRRLKMDWWPPPALHALLATIPLDDASIGARMLFRHARVAWHANQVDLVARLLAKMPAGAQSCPEHLPFLLSLLPEMAPQANPLEFLIEKKRFYFQALHRAETFERQRLASNMEILMLQGARSAHGDIKQWRQIMHRIDHICLALFGWTQHFQPPDAASILDEGRISF